MTRDSRDALVALNGNIYAGLWYPVVVAVITLIVGAIFLRDNTGKPLHEIQVMK